MESVVLCFVVCLLVLLLARDQVKVRSRTRDELNVNFGCSADVCDSAFSQLDACLAILANDVASDIGLALLSTAENAIVASCLDVISPDYR